MLGEEYFASEIDDLGCPVCLRKIGELENFRILAKTLSAPDFCNNRLVHTMSAQSVSGLLVFDTKSTRVTVQL